MKSTNRKRSVLLLITVSALCLLGPASGKLRGISPDLTNMGRLLKVNRAGIKFMDECISNLPEKDGTGGQNLFREEMKKAYADAIQDDFHAQLWYLQRNYSRTYRDLKSSQNKLQNVYRRVLINYIDETWIMLEEAAPLIVRTRDRAARHLLKLGYRDLESAKLFYTRGYNITPSQHTNQIQHYRDGIKRIRRARRYAIRALIEAKLPFSEKPQFRVVTLDDVKAKKQGTLFKESHYINVRNLLVNLMGRRLLPRDVQKDLPREVSLEGRARKVKLDLVEVHQDNYGRLISERRSVWREIVKNLNVSGFHGQKTLPKRNSGNRYFVPREKSGPND